MTLVISCTHAHPDVSVIVPTYNRIAMLEEALQSIYSQTFEGVVQIIVVDDNSRDGTVDVVRQKYPDVCLINLKENVGAYVARNRALRKAKGKYVAFLDSDDLWESQYLKAQLEILEGRPNFFSVSDLYQKNTVTGKNKVILQRPALGKYSSPLHHLFVGTFIFTPSAVVFPYQVFDNVGFFSEESRYGSDTDLYMRCLIAGYEPCFLNAPLVIQRKHDKGQATDLKNLAVRKQGRLKRIKSIYPICEEQLGKVSLKRIYAEINTDYARRYLRHRLFFNYLLCHIKAAFHMSPLFAIQNIIWDFNHYVLSRNVPYYARVKVK